MASEFRKMMVSYLVNGYNHAAQNKLGGVSPHERWLAGVEHYGEPEMVEDLSFANSFGGNITSRVLNPTKGIHLHDLKYNSVALQDLYFRLVKNFGDKCKIEVRWSSQNLKEVMVLDPKTRTYLIVPCTKNLPEGMTLAKWKAQKKVVADLAHTDTLQDSEEFQNVQTRIRDVGRLKGSRKQPPATEAQSMTNEQLRGYFNEPKTADSNCDAELSSAETISEVPDVNEKPVSAPESGSGREFKIRERR